MAWVNSSLDHVYNPIALTAWTKLVPNWDQTWKGAKNKNSKTSSKSKVEARALWIRTRTGINRLRPDLWYHSFLHTPRTQKLNTTQNSKCTLNQKTFKYLWNLKISWGTTPHRIQVCKMISGHSKYFKTTIQKFKRLNKKQKSGLKWVYTSSLKLRFCMHMVIVHFKAVRAGPRVDFSRGTFKNH